MLFLIKLVHSKYKIIKFEKKCYNNNIKLILAGFFCYQELLLLHKLKKIEFRFLYRTEERTMNKRIFSIGTAVFVVFILISSVTAVSITNKKAIDPESDDIYYQWKIDGINTDWEGPYESGQAVDLIITFSTPGDHTIKARAQEDIHKLRGEWSDSFNIKVSKPRNRLFNILDFPIIDRFPLLAKLIQIPIKGSYNCVSNVIFYDSN